MKKNAYWIVFLSALLLLTSCSSKSATPSEGSIQTAIAQTFAANPTSTTVITDTPTPTEEFTPTSTPSPTFSPTPTLTPRPTKTSTPTPTETPTPLPPATLTAQAAIAKKTQESLNITATREALSISRTATAQVKSATATEIASYTQINIKELQSYADQHLGEKVVVLGRVFNIASPTQFQMYYGWTYEAVFVITKDPYTGLYEDDFITVYGVVGGEKCFKNMYNADVCQPLIKDAYFEKR